MKIASLMTTEWSDTRRRSSSGSQPNPITDTTRKYDEYEERVQSYTNSYSHSYFVPLNTQMSPQLPLSPPTKSQHKCSQPSIFSLLKDTDSIQITKQAYHNSTKYSHIILSSTSLIHPYSKLTEDLSSSSFCRQSYSASISNAPSIQKSQSQVTLPAIAASLLIPPSERGSVSQELRMSPPTPINRYVCRTCRKAFSRPSGLRIHSYSHTGEKPFRCTHVGCGKAFNVRSNMKRHERGFHSGRPLAVIV